MSFAVPQDQIAVLEGGQPTETLGDVRARGEHNGAVGHYVEGIDVFEDRIGKRREDEFPRLKIHGIDRADELPAEGSVLESRLYAERHDGVDLCDQPDPLARRREIVHVLDRTLVYVEGFTIYPEADIAN
jgi:hypothetical protein